jgi:hypothetical protein
MPCFLHKLFKWFYQRKLGKNPRRKHPAVYQINILLVLKMIIWSIYWLVILCIYYK